MNATELLDDLVRKLGRISGLPGLELEDGHASLVFNQMVTVHIQARDNDILFYATPGELPEENGYAMALRLLRANFLWRDTGGATLSIAADGDIVLAQTLSTDDLDLTVFQERFTAFARVAAKWKELIESPDETANGSAPAHEEELPAFAMRL